MIRMKWFVETYASKEPKQNIKVLDIGSYDVNGTYKEFFPSPHYEYYGLDMVSGPNVDIVEKNPYQWKDLGTDTFDIVISGQTFEHVEFFWVTMSEMARVLKKGGLMCLIVPNGFGEHRCPVDCYRFFSDGVVALARYVSLEPLHAHTNCAPNPKYKDWYSRFCSDSMLVARKPYSGDVEYVNLNTYTCIPPEQENFRLGFHPQPQINLLARLLIQIYKFITKRFG
jgi:SAM-dependent methyltransferase